MVNDFPKVGAHDVLAETSYRRGFHQGVVAAIAAVTAGFTDRELASWERRIRQWRSKRHDGKVEYPEWLAL